MSNTNMTTIADVQERLDSNRFAMISSIDERGTLSSRPLTVKKIDDNGDLWFIVTGGADWVEPIEGAPVNAAFSDDHTWVSFAGRASLDRDKDRIDALGGPISDGFFDGSAEPVALKVVTDRIEWWASASTATQLVEMVKSTITDAAPDLGGSGAIEV